MSTPTFNQTKGEVVYMKPGGQGADAFLGSVEAESKQTSSKPFDFLNFPSLKWITLQTSPEVPLALQEIRAFTVSKPICQ